MCRTWPHRSGQAIIVKNRLSISPVDWLTWRLIVTTLIIIKFACNWSTQASTSDQSNGAGVECHHCTFAQILYRTESSQKFGTFFNNLYGFRVAHVFWKYLDVVSSRFTARSIVCEMATGNRLRATWRYQNILQNNYIGPNSSGGLNFQEFMVIW